MHLGVCGQSEQDPANPRHPVKNQTKLIEFLSKFQNDRTEDEQFGDEKTYLIKQIRDLKKPTPEDAWEGSRMYTNA